MTYKIIALGLGQCSSVLPFIVDDFDEIIFCNVHFEGKPQELQATYEHLDNLKKMFDITVLDTKIKKVHPPFCSKDGKVYPTRRYLRSKGIKKAIQYVGFTVEERKRARQYLKWLKYEFPLIELGFTREDCIDFLHKKLGYIPARTGCVSCKYFDRPHYRGRSIAEIQIFEKMSERKKELAGSEKK